MNIDTFKKFGKFFEGTSWLWHSSDGVGILMEGFPKDVEKFTTVLMDFSCNPVATQRIIKEMEETGSKKTTLMFGLNFKDVGERLEELGVKMTVIPPYIHKFSTNQGLNDNRTDELALRVIQGEKDLSVVSEEDKKEVMEKIKLTNEMFKKFNVQNKFGVYGS